MESISQAIKCFNLGRGIICKNQPDSFCYVCGKYEIKGNRHKLTEKIKLIYKKCFSVNEVQENKYWIPKFICSSCYSSLLRCYNGNERALKIIKPMQWREPLADHSNCYFCLSVITGLSAKNKKKAVYANVSSVTFVVYKSYKNCKIDQIESHDQTQNEMEIEDEAYSDSSYESDNLIEDDDDDEFSCKNEPNLLDQNKLNDLVRDLGLDKDRSELLASRLKEWNMLAPKTKITFYREREKEFLQFFKKEESIVYCCDIEGLMNQMKENIYKTQEWRLFLDSSKRSLKAVLLHNKNVYAPIPIAHSVSLNEDYNSMKKVLGKIDYHRYKWQLCGDLKVISIMLGQQSGFTKFPCFLCLWDSRDRKNHFIKRMACKNFL